ncbi:D-ribose transporter ATP-binding protein [Sorangium cellulosum]|uniref:D-ribose transporter ATP-binding protein n=1 Tax=Sorangium cellulosum TaxID=56 RepID=A0A2L0F141_SORCE|nr:ATP-binding cassette domain-containing protein [Sorangium cellulosum]AUX45298.1 D-ribose transporter ATP-binding protein [Sorangium cellulosum]
MPLLELASITKQFPGVKALDGVSFDLREGEIHALCGENGAGKSTLIKTLCGYYPAGTYGGEIRLSGQRVEFSGMRSAEEHGIALIAQELALVPELTVAENLVLGREPVRGGLIDWAEVRALARRALERVGLDVDPERPIKDLGIGQQQMVEIAKALLKDARILVLDEPTAALTESGVRTLLSLLGDLRARGVSCIYISHRLEEVFEIADRITVLRDGRSITTQPRAELTPDKVISLMVGREVTNLYPCPPPPEGPVALAVDRWSVEDAGHPGRFVLRDVSFEVRAGEVLGVGGLMGAGRTALVSTIFGAATSRVTGSISVLGRPAAPPFRSPAEAIASGIALVSEDRKRYGLVLESTLLDNLTLATLRRFVKGLFLDHTEREVKALEQMRALRTKAPGPLALANQLSGGNQQKIVIGKWLMAGPRVLLLDEPTRGIDVGAKAEIYRLIHDLAAGGLAVVLVSSELPELLGMSHRVLILTQGRMTACLDRKDATAERVMAAATKKVTE